MRSSFPVASVVTTHLVRPRTTFTSTLTMLPVRIEESMPPLKTPEKFRLTQYFTYYKYNERNVLLNIATRVLETPGDDSWRNYPCNPTIKAHRNIEPLVTHKRHVKHREYFSLSLTLSLSLVRADDAVHRSSNQPVPIETKCLGSLLSPPHQENDKLLTALICLKCV